MDIHKNARLSFRSREALVQHVVERTLTVKAANKWVQRYRAQGHAGLYDRIVTERKAKSPRPKPKSDGNGPFSAALLLLDNERGAAKEPCQLTRLTEGASASILVRSNNQEIA